MLFYDPTYFLVIIGFLLAAIASGGVQSAFNKYSKVKSYRHLTGADAARKILDENGLYNINIPKGDGDIKITRQGGIYFTDAFIYKGDDMYEQAGTMVVSDSKDLTLDTDCVRNGYVTITPLLAERTNLEVFNSLLNIKD